jgi:hypothetical protein
VAARGHIRPRILHEELQEFMVVVSTSYRLLASVVDGGNDPDLNLATRLGIVDCPGDNTRCFAGTFRADDGTRTHDLLHGKQTL